MIRQVLARFGVGTATVRTELLSNKIERGEQLKGKVIIYGGDVKQNIAKIKIHIDSNFHKDEASTQFRDITDTVVDYSIKGIGTINPNEEKAVPFSFSIPHYTPMTFNEQKVTVRTKLITNFKNPPSYSEEIIVTDERLDKILSFLTSHGYKHTPQSGTCRHRKRADDNPTLFLQTFYLVNEKGKEIKFVGNAEDTHIYINDKNNIRHFAILRQADLSERLNELLPYITDKE